MPRTFLPPPQPRQGFTLPQNQSRDFVGGPDSLFDDIHEKMAVADANSEGRAPSPFARVWQFRRNLAGATGASEQARAVETFRGLLALFALRDFYHLDLTVDVTPSLVKDPAKGATPLSRLFEVHSSYLPQPRQATLARFLYNQRLVFFRLKEPAGTPDTVVAGYSPLTLIYPAARSLERSRALKAIFWYDGDRWRDPTKMPDVAHQRLTEEARQHLAAWLDDVLSTHAPDGRRLAILAEEKLASTDDGFLTELLTTWRAEFEHIPPQPAGQAQPLLLPKSTGMQDVERSQGSPFCVPALLEKVYQGTSKPSDYPFRNGTLVLTLAMVENPTRLIYGNVFGSPEIRRLLENKPDKPAEGPDLGAALNRPGEAPVPYVILDHLFTTNLGRLQTPTEGENTVSEEWGALSMSANSKLDGIFLLPFKPAILRYFSPQELRQGVKADDNVAAVQVTFRHEAEGLEVSRLYGALDETNAGRIVSLDPSLDLRFFPNFRLDWLADLDRQLPFAGDRFYHARIRLSPETDRLPMRWLAANGTPLADATQYFEGSFERPADRNLYAPGRQAFWRLPMHVPPAVFQVEGFGFLLLALRGSPHAGETPRAWKVALDFGTTNSCVAVDVGAGNVDAAYPLPVLTTVFLSKWQTTLRGESDEGASALADFMLWQNEATTTLNENDFFPTQILTRHRLDATAVPYPGGFNERNGLAFFPNVSTLGTIERKGFTDLLEGFEAMRTTNLKPRFFLKLNLKWKDESAEGGAALVWRTVFHQHLRLQLLLAAASENAYIDRLVASFPKAFIPQEKDDYQKELEKIWGTADPERINAEAKRSPVQIELRSESAAAALALGITRGQEFFLLDMGGGTTDIAVFKDTLLEEECSLTLAGQALEKYVCRSENLRKQIVRCYPDVPEDRKKAFAAPGTGQNELNPVHQTIFQGFLAAGNGPRALSQLLRHGQKDRATQGFFLSAIFLYTGLAYFCGLWLAKRREGGEGITAEEHLQWLGNGSSFIRMLEVAGKSFEDVLVQMFNAACEGEARVSKLRRDAKTVVVKGLLKAPLARAGAQGQQVFSQLLSDSVSMNGHAWQANEALGDFYRQFNPGAVLAWDGVAEGKWFRHYLEVLDHVLPMAQLNKSALINLPLLGIKDQQHWAVEYVTANQGTVAKELHERLKDNKDRWSDVLQAGVADTLYVEPLFISELVALLEQVREDHL